MTIVGVGQADFKVGDLEHNWRLLQSLLDEAAKANVEILALPELANSGYVFQSRAEAWAASEVIPAGAVCALLAEWSQNNRLVVCGICERDPVQKDKLYNSAVVWAGGKHLTTYRKAHLFYHEPQFFEPGNQEPPVVTYREHRIGVMICFDWFFPEMARILALKGAQLILHPANLVLPYCQAAMITRSIENRVFTATANRFGSERGLSFSGKSQITSPKGDLLIQANGDDQGVVTAEIDLTLADNKMITPENHLLKNRRVDLYGKLIAEG